MKDRPTSYNGTFVTPDEKLQLENQFAGNFLRFSKSGEGFLMQEKYPETGATKDGKIFNIRENMNYFLKAYAGYCLGPDGRIDLTKAEGAVDYFLDGSSDITPNVAAKLADKCNVPPEKKADFITFATASGKGLGRVPGFLTDKTTEYLQNYQSLILDLGKSDPDDPDMDKTRRELLVESYEDYGNLQKAFREMAAMDPEKELRVMAPLDCMQAGYVREHMAVPAMRQAGIEDPLVDFYDGTIDQTQYVAANKGPLNDRAFATMEISFEIQPDEGKDRLYQKFEKHHCSIMNVTLNNEPCTISLENTAPPAGKLIFAPSEVMTGTGLYTSPEALKNYHTEHNTTKINDFKGYKKLISQGDEAVWDRLTHVFPADSDSVSLKEPEKPGLFTRLFRSFVKKYDDEMNRYEAAMADYNTQKALKDNFPAIKKDYEAYALLRVPPLSDFERDFLRETVANHVMTKLFESEHKKHPDAAYAKDMKAFYGSPEKREQAKREIMASPEFGLLISEKSDNELKELAANPGKVFHAYKENIRLLKAERPAVRDKSSPVREDLSRQSRREEPSLNRKEELTLSRK